MAFVEYVRNGGGVVLYHAADNSFPSWKEYNEMSGLGGWGDRNQKDGPYVYYKNNQLVTDTSAGNGGSHGKTQRVFSKDTDNGSSYHQGSACCMLHGRMNCTVNSGDR